MVTAAAGLIGALMGCGIVLAAQGDSGRLPLGGSGGRSSNGAILWSVGAVGGLAVGWTMTDWPAFGVICFGATLVVRHGLSVSRERAEAIAIDDGLASWAESLADVMRSHSGLGQAIVETAPHAAPVLRPALNDLVAQVNEGTLADALTQFGLRLHHSTADLVVAALQLAGDGGGRNLPTVLQKIAEQTRARTEMRARIEAGRARLYTEARVMISITGAMAVFTLIFGRSYLDPYNTAVGQIVMGVVGALFATATMSLVALGRPVELPRPLEVGRNREQRS